MMNQESQLPTKPRRSLRSILIVWFLIFSIGPVAILTVYSIFQYGKAIDSELSQRLMSNGREITSILNDLKSVLQQRRDHYANDASFLYHLSTADELSTKRIATEWMRTEIASGLVFFTRNGRMLVSVYRDEKGNIKDMMPGPGKTLVLSDDNIEKMKFVKSYPLAEHTKPGKSQLILFSKINNASGKLIGYLEQIVDVDELFLSKLKDKMQVELIVLRKNGLISAATLPDFGLSKKNYFENYTKTLVSSYFEHTVRGEPHGFLVYPISWGNSDFFIALGASKKESRAVMKNVNVAFYGVIAAVFVLLAITIWLTSNAFVKPLHELVRATRIVQSSDDLLDIPVSSDTEIGLLTQSFNQMNRNIVAARSELKNKIQELEKANAEIRDTQGKLMHNSKMISLGQLVAGVAHELNNPIGFIYSNMTHLRDYSERLLKYAEAVEQNPEAMNEYREKFEIDFVREDLPKLIASCEDGARRTRDIVIGLRNFSRLEATQLKDLNVNDALDSTLSLLKGELKGRIEVFKKYEDVPLVKCFASQMSQVFMNILSNAVQAIDGPGKIWISTKASLTVKGEMIVIAIQDSGVGMPPDVVEKIFDPFFSTKGVGQGTGLGLSITYGIIQNHGGDIAVKSQIGVGTEFRITIPVKADEALQKMVKRNTA